MRPRPRPLRLRPRRPVQRTRAGGAAAGACTPAGAGATPKTSGGAATPREEGSYAASPAATVCIPAFQSGLALTSLSKLHIFAPPQVRLQVGFSHLPGLHFQEHWGKAHLLSHCSWQIVSHFGGEHTVLHIGQSPCSQCIDGHTMAHLGGSHCCLQVARFRGSQAVSHCGGAHTGSQTSSHAASPQVQKHFGWQPTSLCTAITPVPYCPGWTTGLLWKKAGSRAEGCR
mmetsp:Transcript_30922/g.88997  ORF Transcript_30922/g.88997 Transcript_30922/m.88997 type:complete len:228 (-) Transcript_30922:248-931(-)